MKTPHRSLIVIGLTAAVVLGACGGPGTPTPAQAGSENTAPPATGSGTQAPGPPGTVAPPSASAVDPCALLSDDEIKTATGLVPKGSDGTRPTGIFPASCTWAFEANGVMAAPSLIVSILPGGGATAYQEFLAPGGVPYGYDPISGLGDAASDVGGGAVLVLVGDVLFEVDYVAVKPNDTEIATTLAKAVLGNLES